MSGLMAPRLVSAQRSQRSRAAARSHQVAVLEAANVRLVDSADQRSVRSSQLLEGGVKCSWNRVGGRPGIS
ncbi:hypothetical protein COO55_17715 [Rhodococcus opacus]|nr:hypothetical protein Rwratislav_18274 [Rhodococcus wratislaviensis IFP 2016]RKM73712.1 hypothetical protein COO55_17715 [Rhodococcus opacus]